MNKMYKISTIIMTLLVFLTFNIIFINEDFQWKVIAVIFSVCTFLFSFPSVFFSKKIINFGDNIDGISEKVLYYFTLPFILFAIWLFAYYIDMSIIMGGLLILYSNLLTLMFFSMFVPSLLMIILMLPYVQSLIILILRKIINK